MLNTIYAPWAYYIIDINETFGSARFYSAGTVSRDLHEYQDPCVLPAVAVAAGEFRGGVAPTKPGSVGNNPQPRQLKLRVQPAGPRLLH